MEARTIIEILKKAQKTGESYTPSTLADYGLDGVDCEKCGNTGVIVTDDEKGLYARECECMAKRRALRRIKSSGMEDLLNRYTFDTYRAEDSARERIKAIAKNYAETDSGWLYIAGRSGSGKTHICTAICMSLINSGVDVYYMRWRDECRELKASVTDTETHERHLNKLKRVKLLYIDDFLKGGTSEADIRLAFEIINARYNDITLRTIISSEIDISQLMSIDEALAGRIYERSKQFLIASPNENWRMRA